MLANNKSGHVKDVTMVVLANAFVYICPAIYTTFLSAFLSRDGLTASQIGIIFSLSPLMYLIAAPLWAKLADYTGKRTQILAMICVGAAASLLLFYFSSGFTAYFIAALLLDIFVTSLVPLSDSIVLFRARKLNVPFSTVRLGGTFGYALVVILCGFILTGKGEVMFPAAAGAFMLYALLMLFFPQSAEQGSPKSHKAPNGGILKEMTPEFCFVLAFAFLGYVGLSVISAYMGSFMVSKGYDHMEIAIASTISALSEVPTLLLIRRWTKGKSIVKVLSFCCIMFAVRALLVSSGSLPLIYGASLLQSVTYMPLYYCCVTYVSEHLPPEKQSQGQSMLVLCQSGLGGMVGYLLGGQVIQHVGIPTAYRIFALLVLVGATALGMLYKKLDRKGRLSDGRVSSDL